MGTLGHPSTTSNLAHRRRITEFTAILERLGSAELYLVTCLQRTIWSLRDDIALLRNAAGQGVAVGDEVAILRAELAYAQTILADFIADSLAERRERNDHHVGQRGQTRERGILQVINNQPREHTTNQIQVDRDALAREEQNENVTPRQRPRTRRHHRRVRRQEVSQPPPPY